jgi:hypothetical protein
MNSKTLEEIANLLEDDATNYTVFLESFEMSLSHPSTSAALIKGALGEEAVLSGIEEVQGASSRKATASLDPLSGGVNRWTNCRPGGQAHAIPALFARDRPAFPRMNRLHVRQAQSHAIGAERRSHALRRSERAMNRPLVVIFTAIVLDAVGIGLIFPILPSLLQEVTHTQNVAPYIGIDDRALCGHAVHLRTGARRAERSARPPPGAADFARRRRRQLPVPGLRAQPLDAAARPRHRRPHQCQRLRGDGLHHRHLARGQARPALWPVQRHVRHRLHHRPRARRRPWRHWLRLPFMWQRPC